MTGLCVCPHVSMCPHTSHVSMCPCCLRVRSCSGRLADVSRGEQYMCFIFNTKCEILQSPIPILMPPIPTPLFDSTAVRTAEEMGGCGGTFDCCGVRCRPQPPPSSPHPTSSSLSPSVHSVCILFVMFVIAISARLPSMTTSTPEGVFLRVLCMLRRCDARRTDVGRKHSNKHIVLAGHGTRLDPAIDGYFSGIVASRRASGQFACGNTCQWPLHGIGVWTLGRKSFCLA